jgi:hypothetical protein
MRIFWLVSVTLYVALAFPAVSAAADSTSTSTPPTPTPADLYVRATSTNGGQPCTPAPDLASVITLVETKLKNLQPPYDVALGDAAGPNQLSAYPKKRKGADKKDGVLVSNVIVATICRTADVYSISVVKYAVDESPPTSGSLTGTFDALQTADWSSAFGPTSLFPNVAFLPIVNDTNNVINPRLQRNLPLTVIATPAPAPIAPPSAGSPPPPLPPTTRLAECRASNYKMLIIGRTTASSTSTDLTRGIVAASALKLFTQKNPWGTIYSSAGVLLAALYTPSSAEASVDMFTCASPKVLVHVGGKDFHITGHSTLASIGVDPYGQQRALDNATLDLANQLDCIIHYKLADLNILSPEQLSKARTSIYPYDEKANSQWCTDYYKTLKTKFPDRAVEAPIKSQ